MKRSEVVGAFERSSHPRTETSCKFIYDPWADGVLKVYIYGGFAIGRQSGKQIMGKSQESTG
jgi:hypothetical protein